MEENRNKTLENWNFVWKKKRWWDFWKNKNKIIANSENIKLLDIDDPIMHIFKIIHNLVDFSLKIIFIKRQFKVFEPENNIIFCFNCFAPCIKTNYE